MSLDSPDNPYAPPQSTVADVSVPDPAQPSRPRFGIRLQLLLAATAIWCVGLPFQWAHNLSVLTGLSYLQTLDIYRLEVITAAITAASFVLLAFRPRLAVFGFAAAAAVLILLKAWVGSSATGVWPIAAGLLGLVTWRLHVRLKRTA